MDCGICCESINKGIRREVKCPYCEFITCLTCFRKYLMESIRSSPDCMSCHRELSLDFISEVTPKIFHNQEYRKKRTEDLISQERSLLPDTQHLVRDRMEKLNREKEIYELMKEERRLKYRIREIKELVKELRKDPKDDEKTKNKRKKFIMGCPDGECRGFLSQSWKCGTCGIYACSKCRVVKNTNDTHICNEDDVATANLLKAETKPCPKCAVPIFKINGCDQMFCMSCHTPFSWNTGDIVTGVIHNPHFYQWQREQNGGIIPRVAGDFPNGICGELPWVEEVRAILKYRKHKFKKWENCHMLVGHIREIVMPRYPFAIGIDANTYLRVEYLTKEIDEKKWTSTLKMRQKKSEKDHDLNQILNMFVTSLTDIFKTYVSGSTNDLEKDAVALRSYANKELMIIGHRYNNKVPSITDDWTCR